MNKEEIKKANTTGPMVKSSIAETSFLGRLIGKHDFEDHYWSPFLGAAAANRSTTPSLPKRSYLDSICQGSTNQKRRSNKKNGKEKKENRAKSRRLSSRSRRRGNGPWTQSGTRLQKARFLFCWSSRLL